VVVNFYYYNYTYLGAPSLWAMIFMYFVPKILNHKSNPGATVTIFHNIPSSYFLISCKHNLELI